MTAAMEHWPDSLHPILLVTAGNGSSSAKLMMQFQQLTKAEGILRGHPGPWLLLSLPEASQQLPLHTQILLVLLQGLHRLSSFDGLVLAAKTAAMACSWTP